MSISSPTQPAEPLVNFGEEFDIEIPSGTQVIVPFLSDWELAFGEANFGDRRRPGLLRNHKFGRACVIVRVIDISPNLVFSQPGTARIKVIEALTDKSHLDKWAGAVDFHLMFLGNPIEPSDRVEHPNWQPLEVRRQKQPES